MRKNNPGKSSFIQYINISPSSSVWAAGVEDHNVKGIQTPIEVKNAEYPFIIAAFASHIFESEDEGFDENDDEENDDEENDHESEAVIQMAEVFPPKESDNNFVKSLQSWD
ncbi:hypothetical protein L6452_37585 [Arctium lappa]|uniref:Uncharacterized protein n=1 Tax=Arctium lappa TaxID=4217 RepID=A0ACB8Y4X4_ARCLA|nr:hypothetical protein L6452_37585 [Arctium lappa]